MLLCQNVIISRECEFISHNRLQDCCYSLDITLEVFETSDDAKRRTA